MAAGELDLDIEQGNAFSRTITLKNDDNSPVNLSGFTIASQIRELPGSTEIAAQFSVSMPTPSSGVFTISLTHNQTAALRAPGRDYKSKAKFVWDLDIIDANSVPERILNGNVTVSPQVTR